MREIRRTAGLGRLPEGEIRRSASIAKQWREAGRSLDEIVWAIQGWRALTDRGVTWLRAREPFTLRALRNTRCVVEHHSGERVVRAAFEVAVEASPTPRRPTRKPAGSSQLSSVADLIARLVPHA